MTERTATGVSSKSGSPGKLDGAANNDDGQRDPDEDVSCTGTVRIYFDISLPLSRMSCTGL